MVWTWLPVSGLPKVYDVIWCRFPHRPVLHRPADPPHPVLVRDVESYPDLGQAIVHVTYGTSNLKKESRALLDVIVDRPIEMLACGLKEPTRFDLDDKYNLLPLEWCLEYFPDARAVGSLNADGIRRLNNRLRDRGYPV